MSDVPRRPRIRPATSDDWQNDQSDRTGQGSSPESAEFDDSTYYEYIQRHTGDFPVARTHQGYPQPHLGGYAQESNGPTTGGGATGGGVRVGTGTTDPGSPSPWGVPYGAQNPPGPQGPNSGSYPALDFAQPESRKATGLKVTVVIVAIVLVLALLAFFGVRWLAPSTGTIPAEVGDDPSGAVESPSNSADQDQSAKSPAEALDEYTNEGTAAASALEGSWVTQVSAKKVGIETDGQTWEAEDILAEFEANQVKYPGSILIYSGDWGSYKVEDYWVTVVNKPYSSAEPALEQCRTWGLDRDHCLAKRLVKDGGPEGNSKYLED